MYLLFLAYSVAINLVILALLLASNRPLHKYRITKSSFFFVVMVLQGLLSALLFLPTVNYVLMLSIQFLTGFILYKGYRNYNLIGLTGTMGSGKSTLVEMIRARLPEIAVIDSDKISDELFQKNRFFTWFVRQLFRSYDIYGQDGEINKPKIGKIIFDPSHKTLKTVYLLWIYIFIFSSIFGKIFQVFWSRQFTLALIDAPLLFETKILRFICYPIITVYVDNEDKLIERIMLRSPELPEQDIRFRIKHQMPTKTKLELSDGIICNNATRQAMYDAFLNEIYKG